ncbi:DUF2807 domain-containing protein [Hymenobacter aerilatus]|uniref:DUF2807 domain-containing protein n=1 Tax=Hymenobacter aerilatus TaxID=2932251 RepID=A0A8T9SWS9_9BACT|nr:DUF2807 domain-containing protein [Hymenobacter aerilatus]UOR06285.1 DUF2807 domain-containing protein [Hymenobacter aerilatus]
MKKNISINLQGIIFHIEEDGYEVLGRYLAEVKAHFSGYRGHEEIVADIESRIAELFVSRLSPSKQIISLEDVEQMVAKMGRVRDFQAADEAEEDEETLASAVASGTAEGFYTGTTSSGTGSTSGRAYTSSTKNTTDPDTATAASDEPRRLTRDMANRKVAGVAAGLGRYFAVNPLWFRLAFVGLLLAGPALDDISWLEELGGKLSAFSVIAYVVLWIALPKRYDNVLSDEDPNFRKLYRDVDSGKIGGVSAGLAAYFRTDVVLIRVLFLAGLFAGGFAFLVYIILWILVPEAKTASDRLRMRGDAVTLSALDSNLRASEEGAVTPGNRPIGTFIEGAGRNLRPAVGFVGTLIRVAAGVLLVATGFGLLLAFTIALGVGLGVLPESQGFIHTGPFPPYLFTNSVPSWALLAFYAAGAIPVLAMFLLGLGLILRRPILSRIAGLSLLGLWLLSVVGASAAGVRISRDFQMEGEVTQTERFPTLTAATVLLDNRTTHNDGHKWVDLNLTEADSGQVLEVVKYLSARGVTEQEAIRTASTSIRYTARATDNATLILDDYFTFQPDARFRDQDLDVTLRLPQNKRYRLSKEFADRLDSENFSNNEKPESPETRTYEIIGSQLHCIECTSSDFASDDEQTTDEEGENDGVDVRINESEDGVHINTDTDENGNVKVNIDIPKAEFPTDFNSYGDGRRTYSFNDFRTIQANGAYRVLVRQGSEFKVEAAGEDRDLRDLQISTNGNELLIRHHERGFWSNWKGNRNPVLVRVTMPAIDKLELNGACQADVAGFNEARNLNVEQNGACAATLAVNATRLSLDLSGACQTTLRGQANDLVVDGSGACQVDALGLTARTANFDLSGASNAKARVQESLKVDLSGASEVKYAGNPSRISKDVSRGSSLVAIRE